MVKMVQPIPKPRKAAHYVRAWRTYRGLTQEQLAGRIDATAGSISQLENGIVSYTQPTLEAIANALNCQPGDLLSRDPRISDAVAELSAILQLASDADRKKAIRVIKEMLGTGTDE